jgi:hypothetical protein
MKRDVTDGLYRSGSNLITIGLWLAGVLYFNVELDYVLAAATSLVGLAFVTLSAGILLFRHGKKYGAAE